jgi:hypothetical protein
MLWNQTGTARTATIYTDGAVAANVVAAIQVPANGSAVYTSTEGWQVLDANGVQLMGVADGSIGLAQLDPLIFPVGYTAAQSFTPTWITDGTAPSLGNGTLTGSYMEIADRVFFEVTLTIGSTTTMGTGNFFFTFPVTPGNPAVGATRPIGMACCYDTSAGTRFFRTCGIWTTGTWIMHSEGGTRVSATSPMTWANGDVMAMTGTYQR